MAQGQAHSDGISRRGALALLGTAALTACSSAGPGSSSGPATPVTGTGTVPSPTATTTPPATAPIRAITGADTIAADLPTPWGLWPLADGSVLVSLRDEARVVQVFTNGKVRSLQGIGRDGRVPDVVPGGEGGLLGIAVNPDDPTRLFAYLSTANDNRVVRMTLGDGTLGRPVVVLAGIPRGTIHNGGRLGFGPDGRLYVSTGETGQRGLAQDRSSLGGKILRITQDGDPAPGNPFPGSPVWTLGHRNVQGFGWDAHGRMYADEFGQDTWDELNRIEPGRNYGWPVVEGKGDAADAKRGYTPPLVQWHTDDASPSGLAVGRGSIFLAALQGQRIWRVPLHDDGSVGTPVDAFHGLGRMRAVAFTKDGDLLALTGNRFRGDPRPGDDRLVRLRVG